MKIDEAIELLSDSANRGVTTFNQDYENAQKLGIEALKRIKAIRPYSNTDKSYYLLGETKD